MTYNELFEQVKKKKSFLCVGLDSDIKKIPQHLMDAEDPVFEFNKAIVDATADVAIAYKPNIAFYESRGVEGWITLEKTVKYINPSTRRYLRSLMPSGEISGTLPRCTLVLFSKHWSSILSRWLLTWGRIPLRLS